MRFFSNHFNEKNNNLALSQPPTSILYSLAHPMLQAASNEIKMDKERSSKSVIDRAVHDVIEASTTPSQADGISSRDELMHRLHGTSLLAEAFHILFKGKNCNVHQSSLYATACVLFHRFYHRVSLKDYDVWSVAMAACVLSSKLEEFPFRLRRVILVFAHLYRRRRLCVGYVGEYRSGDRSMAYVDRAPNLSDEEKLDILRFQRPLSEFTTEYNLWKDALIVTESYILRELGFTLHWVRDSHPHKFLLYMIKAIHPNHENLSQTAWNYCNDSLRLDLCVRYKAEVVASAAILLAANKRHISLPMHPRPWWVSFLGDESSKDISQVCNAILSLYDNEVYVCAYRAFIRSILKHGSFNDPGSQVWDCN